MQSIPEKPHSTLLFNLINACMLILGRGDYSQGWLCQGWLWAGVILVRGDCGQGWLWQGWFWVGVILGRGDQDSGVILEGWFWRGDFGGVILSGVIVVLFREKSFHVAQLLSKVSSEFFFAKVQNITLHLGVEFGVRCQKFRDQIRVPTVYF